MFLKSWHWALEKAQCLNHPSNTSMKLFSDAGSFSGDVKWAMAIQSIVTDLLEHIPFCVNDFRFVDKVSVKGIFLLIYIMLNETKLCDTISIFCC